MFSDHRKDIIDAIQQLYWLKVCKANSMVPKLSLYGVSSKFLGDYVTSEKDMIRRINRKPSTFFLLNGAGDEQDSQEDPFFDSFVVVDKDEIKKKLNLEMPQEKLDKEEKLKNDGKSVLVHGGGSFSETALEDFKIKKLIDKGSFGKVFLVVNTRNNKEYAMKRINKDILIEKG